MGDTGFQFTIVARTNGDGKVLSQMESACRFWSSHGDFGRLRRIDEAELAQHSCYINLIPLLHDSVAFHMHKSDSC